VSVNGEFVQVILSAESALECQWHLADDSRVRALVDDSRPDKNPLRAVNQGTQGTRLPIGDSR
jgi:hypothetical protein